jgi:glycosyltransferase involved in cell wall biosynthesis
MENSNPLVSVVMTVYNGEPFLSEAIQSILNQTYTNFEFIIVEDCSSDNSRQTILDFAKKDSRIVYILHEENKGINYSRKEYMQHAKGKYCAVIDADDVFCQLN